MTEECNHIQMFQELVNRSGTDVPGMRKLFFRLSPYIGLVGQYSPTAFMAGILAGEEPIDHFQKALIREGADIPPAVLRTMQIHIAEEARHISWANEFLKTHWSQRSWRFRAFATVAFPVLLRYLAFEIMTPQKKAFMAEFDIPQSVFREAFWRGPRARCLAARHSGSGWPRRSGRGWRVSCTCWTSRRSACTSVTTAALSTRWCACATWATR